MLIRKYSDNMIEQTVVIEKTSYGMISQIMHYTRDNLLELQKDEKANQEDITIMLNAFDLFDKENAVIYDYIDTDISATQIIKTGA